MKTKKYIERCQKEVSRYAAVPVAVAADYLGITREAVSERIRKGSLDAISIKGKDRGWKLVLVSSLINTQKEGEDMMIEKNQTIRKLLEVAAQQQDVICYGDLMAKIDLSYRNPQHRKIIGTILGAISEESYDDSEFGLMLSAIAVRKNSGLPNEAFFWLATDIGAKAKNEDNEEFWNDQKRKIYKYYAKKKR